MLIICLNKMEHLLFQKMLSMTFYVNKFDIVIMRTGCRRYQRGNHNPQIEEGQTTQLPNVKGQNDKQRFTKHTYKTKDRLIRTPPKTGCEHMCSGRVNSSCSTSDTRDVNLFTNPVISHK